MNKVIMMGRMVADPELKTTPQGTTVCSFRIAVDRNYQKKGEEKRSDFFNVVAWRGTAEFVSKYFPKGRMILVEGEMTTRQYTDKNGNPATWYEIVADNIYFTGDKPANSGNYGEYYGANGYGSGSYGANNSPAQPSQSAPAAQNTQPVQQSGTPDFSSADSDDYPF